MASFILKAVYALTRSRAVSEMIWQRECDRRWAERVAAHRAAGGSVVTVEMDGGSQTYLTGRTVTVQA